MTLLDISRFNYFYLT